MTVTEPVTATHRTFDSVNPATGEILGTYPVQTAEEVAAAVQRARETAPWLAGLGFSGRGRLLRAWRSALVSRSAELVELVRAENGKPRSDAMLEIIPAVQHLDWASK